MGVRPALQLVASSHCRAAAVAALLQLASSPHQSRRSPADQPPCSRGQSRETSQLEQQTATSEILRVISQSPTDVQPVFAAVLQRALILCEVANGSLYLLEDGALRHVAVQGTLGGSGVIGTLVPLESAPGRAVLEKRPVHLEDASRELDWQAPEVVAGILRSGVRTVVAVPLLRQSTAIGAILVRRLEVRPFSGKQIQLLETFADQAVIAIENVRLFTELQEKNSALTTAHARVSEALEQQTATAEILRVISQSQTDVQPVFDAIARNAVSLCGGIHALVLRLDGLMLHVAGHHNIDPRGVEQIRRAFPQRPGRDTPVGRAFLDRIVVHVPDLEAAASEFAGSTARQRGIGSMLAVPLLREQEAVGVIGLAREVVGPFSPEQIEVLQTFADQAVIAIENVRLFKELEAANHELAA